MINFRFHLVSLIAVFLSLALGIVIGSTLIDRAIVDALRNRIDSVEANLDDRIAANDRLRAQVEQSDTYVEESAPYAVQDRLTDVPALVIAPRGLNADVVDDTVERLRQAGAHVPGVLWFTELWRLEEEGHQQALAEVLAAGSTSTEGLRELGLRTVASEVGGGGSVATLEALVDSGFVELGEVGGVPVDVASLPADGTRVVVATGTEASWASEIWTEPLIRALSSDARPTVLAETFAENDSDAKRAQEVAFVRDDDVLSGEVSTVDDLEHVAGRVAVILALDDLGDGVVGHYGFGAGAESSVPVFVEP